MTEYKYKLVTKKELERSYTELDHIHNLSSGVIDIRGYIPDVVVLSLEEFRHLNDEQMEKLNNG